MNHPDPLSQAMDRYADAIMGLDNARQAYYAAIRDAHGAGGSLRAIAEQTGLSHQRVAQIVAAEGGNDAR